MAVVAPFTVPTTAMPKLSFKSPNEILAMEFDDSDLILGDRIMAETQSAALCGAGGVGKSRVIQQIAVCQILNLPFCDRLVTHGRPRKWLFFQTENSMRRQKWDTAHLKKWVEHLYPGDASKWELVEQHLLHHTLENDDDEVLQVEVAAPMIEAAIAEHKPDVPVFDPLKDFTFGDLNQDQDMLAVIRELKRLAKEGNPNRAAVFLHHALTGKAGALKAVGYDRSSFGRNSKALQATMRAQVNMVPYDGTNNERLVVACGKNNNGPEFKPFAIELNTLPGTAGFMIYELMPDFDVEKWQEEMANGKAKKPLCSVEGMAELLPTDGSGWEKIKLVKAAMRETGISQATGYRLVEDAIKDKLIHFSKVEKLCFAQRPQ